MTAVRARFGSIGRVYQHDLSSSVCSFGDKSLTQVAPARVQNALAEVVVTDQVVDTQVFQSDQVVGLCVAIGHFVEQVLALILDMFVQALDTSQRFTAILASLLCALQGTLSEAQLALSRSVVFGRFDSLASAVSEQVLDIEIDPNLLPGWFKCDRIR